MSKQLQDGCIRYTWYMSSTFLRGVNLGGWLVLEKWMTPSLFAGTDAIDEYTFMQTPEAAKKLEQHRRTFITEKDFKWLKAHGLNAVRLPIGYWLLEPDGLYKEGMRYVDWAFRMAEKYELQVLLDLHGAPASQNGHDHSGRSGGADWFNDTTARQRTVTTLQTLHRRYKNSPSYWGIELLNEPRTSWYNPLLRLFYRQAAAILDGNKHIVFHDGFRPRLMSGALQPDKRVVMDVHLYHMASWIGRYMPAERFVQLSGWWWGHLLRKLTKKQSVIIGEWSIVINGKKLRNMNKTAALALMDHFGEEQQVVYAQFASGWFYWSYKTEEQGYWNFRWLVEKEILRLPR